MSVPAGDARSVCRSTIASGSRICAFVSCTNAGGFAFHALCPDTSLFAHLGTSRELHSLLTGGMADFTAPFHLTDKAQCAVTASAELACRNAVVINSVLEGGSALVARCRANGEANLGKYAPGSQPSLDTSRSLAGDV